MLSPSERPWTAGILAGGRSARFGQDKASFLWQGERLIDRQIALLNSLHPAKIIISCREEQNFTFSNAQTLHDQEKDIGPIEGLRQILREIVTDFVLVIAVDMPRLEGPTLSKLLGRCRDENKGVIFCRDDLFEPLCAIYPKTALALIEEQILQGEKSLQDFARLCLRKGMMVSLEASPEDLQALTNMNSPKDIQQN